MFLKFRRAIPRINVTATVVNVVIAAYLLFFANGPFWHSLLSKPGLQTAGHWTLLCAAGLGICLIFNILFSFFSLKPVHKPILIGVLFIAAIVNYFMSNYGIVIDKQMITNLLETDVREASEQLTLPLLRHLFLMGLLPIIILLLTRITYRPWRQELMVRAGVILASLTLLALIVMPNFKEIAFLGREHKELRMYINPTYPIYSLVKTINKRYSANHKEPLRIVAPDAVKSVDNHRKAVIIVVGETARAQEFSLNGYQRNTNPLLSARNVINFTDVQSCGTDTAESLPCMFSNLGRANYSRSEAMRNENLLDVMQRTGVQVVWRDNNSGSKGVADRIMFEDMSKSNDKALCSSGECYDEILLKDLDRLLSRNNGDLLVILHQKGSHGPSYYKRVPKNFELFLPECRQDNVQDCDTQSIVNAYDNTILYTDYLLARVIDLLQAQKYATAMLYVSDHGESLGENNIYLHGLPYSFAPDQQTHIPMIFWASPRFLSDMNIDPAKLLEHRNDPLSHDILFHSMLGLFRIQTREYHPQLDLFHVQQYAHHPLHPHS